MSNTRRDTKRDTRDYPLPEREEQRLRELEQYDILDTPADEKFDKLTEIAERELEVDVAAVTLIDRHRQWLKAVTGVNCRETDRGESFCTYTILSDEVLVIEDTRTADRFDEEHAMIEGQAVRSYAGAPLITSRGLRLGSFCVYSFQPREYSREVRELLCLLRDQAMSLIETQNHKKQLQHLANHDSVTGFLKRHSFDDELPRKLKRHVPDQQRGALFHVDVSEFRRITESLGLYAGDHVLEILSDRLKTILPDSSLKSRILGNEFLLFVEGLENREDAREHARTIIEALREPIQVEDKEFVFSIRVGISLYPKTAGTANSLKQQAQEALKQTSREESSSVKIYLENMDQPGEDHPNLETAFTKALWNDELFLKYQPKVDLESGSVTGMEALLRWEHEEAGFVPPPTIISIADRLGKMTQLGQWVLFEACLQVHGWNRDYDLALDVGVNVSAIEFLQGQRFADNVRSTLEETGLRPSHLEIEVTETEAMENLSYTVELLEELQELGVAVAIDDFGTGRSSLEYLNEFPDPILKIDRAFVDGVTSSPTQKIMVRSFLSMANELGLDTVAEGVERKEEETFLSQQNCTWYQGYYFSKPLQPAVFEETVLEGTGV